MCDKRPDHDKDRLMRALTMLLQLISIIINLFRQN